MCGLYTEDECIYLIAVDKLKINSDFEVTNTITHVSNALKDNNIDFFKTYFETREDEDGKPVRVPKSVTMDYPVVLDSGNVKMKKIEVPLLSLIPMHASKLGKATFSIDFQLEEKDDDVIVHFPKQDTAFGKKIPMSHLEICITPDEIPEGMTTIIDNYNSILQNQLEE